MGSRPKVSTSLARQLATSLYNIDVLEISELKSHSDRNFYILAKSQEPSTCHDRDTNKKATFEKADRSSLGQTAHDDGDNVTRETVTKDCHQETVTKGCQPTKLTQADLFTPQLHEELAPSSAEHETLQTSSTNAKTRECRMSREFVLKITSCDDEKTQLDTLEIQSVVLRHLQSCGFTCPQIQQNVRAELFTVTNLLKNGENFFN